MANIVLSRINERLIHGKVGGCGWDLPGLNGYWSPTMRLPTIPYNKI